MRNGRPPLSQGTGTPTQKNPKHGYLNMEKRFIYVILTNKTHDSKNLCFLCNSYKHGKRVHLCNSYKHGYLNMEKGFTYELLIILKTFIFYVILTNKTHDSRFPFFKNKFKTTVNFA